MSEFERELAEIVGTDLARDLVQFARSPTALEARLLTSDGIAELSGEQRVQVLALIERHAR